MSSTPQRHQPSRSSQWTEEMRDRQARGKNPYSDDSDASDPDRMELGVRQPFESHVERERRGEAMFILDNPAALMAHAQASGDSIAGQRLRFMRQLCGLDDKHNDTSTSTYSARTTVSATDTASRLVKDLDQGGEII
ncbi:hypothetical protein FBEOM_5588 [Fusarium beomiforme]|uniref:Uncharacterized protein n=1 Tax=Fusarium beomiforme TaxID=44412 RepID=A0A9P5AKK9_9HYPO|nr:hypothetical protein FBEOM_5588 [Fusarium beomiforme]